MKAFIWFSVFFRPEPSCFVSGLVKCLCTVYNSVEHKLELLSSLKSKDETSKSSECDLGDLSIFLVEKSVFFSTTTTPSLKLLLVREMRESWSGAWVPFLRAWGREPLLIKSWSFGLSWEDFLLFLALKPVSSTMSYFSNPPQRAAR